MSALRVVHANTYDCGGAAQAGLRLHHALLAAGVESRFVVAGKSGEDPTVIEAPGRLHRWLWPLTPRLDYRIARLLAPWGPKPWGSSMLPGSAFSFIESLRPDIIHLHGVSHGFLSIAQIGRLTRPVVWTLHDLWALGPGYGYRIEAEAALQSVEPFQPLVVGAPFHRLARNIWNRKLRHWRRLNLTLVAPSRWLAEEARRSEIFRGRPVLTIPYSVPLQRFRPIDRVSARTALGLPQDRPLLLFGAAGADAPRKGADLLGAALSLLTRSRPDLRVVVFGPASEAWLRDCPIEVHRLGAISDEDDLARVYAACDLFACPSREDNLPNTVLESLACGTPVVGFRVGGLPDLVQDGINGFLAAPFDTAELAKNIQCVLDLADAGPSLGAAARRLAEERYSPGQTSLRYLPLYRELMNGPPTSRGGYAT